MTSTTPSYLKRAGQGRPARRAYAQWRAEQRRVLPCFARALVYAPAPLFFFFPCLRCSARASVCGRPLFRPLFIQHAIPTRTTFLSLLTAFPSHFYFVSFPLSRTLFFLSVLFASLTPPFLSTSAHAAQRLVRWLRNVVNYFTHTSHPCEEVDAS